MLFEKLLSLTQAIDEAHKYKMQFGAPFGWTNAPSGRAISPPADFEANRPGIVFAWARPCDNEN